MFAIVALPYMRNVFRTLWKSSVLEIASARPNGSIDGMFPRAYSSAHVFGSIRYPFATPAGMTCWSPGR